MVIYTVIASSYVCTDDPCNIVCDWNTESDSTTFDCAYQTINGSAVNELNILCPSSISCINTTVICPVSTSSNSLCTITCTDSNSCDATKISTKSTNTKLNCLNDNVNKSNICTNDVKIDVLSSDIESVVVNCNLTATHNEHDIMINNVCDNIEVKQADYSTKNGVALFYCVGDGIVCDSIVMNASNVEMLNVTIDGVLSKVNGSKFINNKKFKAVLSGGTLVSDSLFTGHFNENEASAGEIYIELLDESTSNANSFIFSGKINKFEMTGSKVSTSSLINGNNIDVTNSNDLMGSISIISVDADLSNSITAQSFDKFYLNCEKDASSICGNIGSIDLKTVNNTNIVIGPNVNFSSNINVELNSIKVDINILDGAIVNGLSLTADTVDIVNFNNYGKTLGHNAISATQVNDGLFINCKASKSCGGDLEIYTTPQKTNITCIGNGCDKLSLTTAESADELSYNMVNCSCKQERKNLCISQWNIKCQETKSSIIENGECSGDSDCCGNVINKLEEKYPNPYICPRTNQTTYICQQGEDCTVDCLNPMQFNTTTPFQCQSPVTDSNNIIDASMAKSVTINCDSMNGTCNSLKIICPNAANNNNKNFCDINCKKSGSCSNLVIQTLQSEIVSLSCDEDQSCNSVLIDNDGANEISNTISIECLKGECMNIDIKSYSSAPTILVDCTNATCGYINVNNTKGMTEFNLDGINSALQYSIIEGNPLKIAATGRLGNILQFNTFIMTGDAIIDCPSNVEFLNNALQSEESSILTTINNGSISFNKTDNIYTFNTAQDIQFALTETQSFTNNVININNQRAFVHISNQKGTFFGNTINADQVNLFVLNCQGKCFQAKANSPNTFNLENADNSYFYVGNGDILDSGDITINALLASNLTFVAQSGGVIQDLTIGVIPIAISLSNVKQNNTQQIFINNNAKLVSVQGDASIQILKSLVSFNIDVSNASNTLITGQSYTFQDNIIKTNVNGILNMEGDNTTTFTNNTLIGLGKEIDSKVLLSINNGNRVSKFNVLIENKQNLLSFAGDATMYIINQLKDNKIVVSNTASLNINGGGNAMFENNTISITGTNGQQSSFLLSMNNGQGHNSTNGIQFVLNNGNQYIFNQADYINITTTINNNANRFTNNKINIMNKDAILFIVNNGIFANNSVNSDELNTLNLNCNGNCFSRQSTSSINNFNIKSITKSFDFSVGNGDQVNKANTKINCGKVESIAITVNENGRIDGLEMLNVKVLDQVNVLNNDGLISNLSVNASNLTFVAPSFGLIQDFKIKSKTGPIMISLSNAPQQNNTDANLLSVHGDTSIQVLQSLARFNIDVSNASNTLFTGQSYIFEDNIIKTNMNGILNMEGDDDSTFKNNSLIGLGNKNDSKILLSINDGNPITKFNVVVNNKQNTLSFNGDAAMNIVNYLKNSMIMVNNKDTFYINGDGNAIFENNTITNTDGTNSSFILSMNNGQSHNQVYGIQFVLKNGNQYIFNQSDYINITTNAVNNNANRFTDNKINIMNNEATLFIINNGIFTNNSVNSDELNTLNFKCNGTCFSKQSTSSMNNFNIKSITGSFDFSVSNGDKINKENTNINVENVESILMTANENGTIDSLELLNIKVLDQLTVVNNNGIISNVSINASNAQFFTLQCNSGCKNVMKQSPNMFYLDNVPNIGLIVSDDAINENNTKLLELSANAVYQITLSENAVINDLILKSDKSVNIENDGGVLNNISIDATDATSFQLTCSNNGCLNSNNNNFKLNSVDSLIINVNDDTLSSTNTNLNGLTNVSTIDFTIDGEHSVLSGYVIDSDNTEIISIKTMNNGKVENIEIKTDKIDTIKIINNNGIIDSLSVEPKVINNIIVNNIGQLSNSVIDGVNVAKNLSIICSSNDVTTQTNTFCNNLTIHTPDLSSSSSSAKLICVNEGCQDMTFYTKTNIDDISLSLIDCDCDKAVKDSCISNEFNIYCDESSKTPSIFKNNDCSGKCCGDIITDLQISTCDYSGSNNKNNTGAIVGGVCGGVLFLVIVGFGIYYYRKKKIAKDQALLLND